MWEIGKRLRTARGNRTIDDSARRVGISQGYLSNLETGRKTPNWDLLAKLAQLYEVSADEILGLKAPAAPPYVKEIASVLEGTTAGMRDEALAILRLMAERDKQRQADVKYYRWLLDVIEAGGGPEAVDELHAALDAGGGSDVIRARLLNWFRQRFPGE